MSYWKTFGLAIFAAVCLLDETTGSAHAQCDPSTTFCVTEWSGGKVINLEGLLGTTASQALGINDPGQVVGVSVIGTVNFATEWSGGSVINLGGLPGSTISVAQSINDIGQVVGVSLVGGVAHATEWSGIGGSVINLGAFQALRVTLPKA
jgi:uncharacterized membrane protein